MELPNSEPPSSDLASSQKGQHDLLRFHHRLPPNSPILLILTLTPPTAFVSLSNCCSQL